MHGLPADFDPVLFVGRDLDSVSFSINTIHLTFGDDLSITLMTNFHYRRGLDEDTCTQSLPPTEGTLLPSLVTRRVVAADARPDGTLRLEFENGGQIDITDDSSMYESYSIRIDNREIYV